MTCKYCIHYEVCKELRYGDISNCDSKDCGGNFKNKADFVEVVRCCDCKHQEQCCEFIQISGKDKTLDFCSYGERK